MSEPPHPQAGEIQRDPEQALGSGRPDTEEQMGLRQTAALHGVGAPQHEEPRQPGVPPHQPHFDPRYKELLDEASEESFPSSDAPSVGGRPSLL
jgi:hypothetical protein